MNLKTTSKVDTSKFKNFKNFKKIENNESKQIIPTFYNQAFNSVYLFLGDLSEKKRNDFRNLVQDKIYDVKSQIKYLKGVKQNVVNFSNKNLFENHYFNKSLSTYYLYRDLNNQLFLKKLTNVLMIHGQRGIARRIILNLFEILKRKFKISDPFIFLKYYIFKNIVPTIKSKIVGFKRKKVIGIHLSIYKRLGLSLKLFVKGARLYNYPIVLGLLIEFFKLFKNKSYLQMCNKKTIYDIKVNRLYKYLQLTPNSVLPEKKFLSSVFPKKKKGKYKYDRFKLFTLGNLIKINWEKFDEIVQQLHLRNNKRKFYRQKLILKELHIMIKEKYKEISDQKFFFQYELEEHLPAYIRKNLTQDDYDNFYLGINPKNIYLDFVYKKFKDNAKILNLFKTIYVWKSYNFQYNE